MAAPRTPIRTPIRTPTRTPNPKSSREAPTARKPTARPSRPYHHGNLRSTLLEAAEAVLAERGQQAVSLREVARAAGVSHAAPYHHFASLDALLAAIAERGFLALGDAMAQAATATDSRERLLRVAQAYLDCARAQPARFRLMFGPLLASKDQHNDLQAAAQRAFNLLLAAANAHDSQHGASLALAGWSLAHGLSHLVIDGAFDGLPMKQPNLDTLARKLAERLS